MLASVFALAHVTTASSPPPDLTPLRNRINKVAKSFQGRLGWHLKLLRTGQAIGYRDQERFPSASTIKTALMVEAMRQVEAGKLKWTDKFPLPPEKERNSSMWAAFLKEGLSIDVDGMVNLMMNVSDNTTTVMLGRILGPNNIERTLLSVGLKETAWTSSPPADNPRLVELRYLFQNMGVTTPAEMNRLLELIHLRKAASPAACEKMLRIMAHQYWDDFIAASVPPDVMVCAKVGALNRSRSDVAIVYGPEPYILSIYTDWQKDRRWVNENAGNEALRKISGIVWNGLNPKRPYSPPPGTPLWFPTGGGVE